MYEDDENNDVDDEFQEDVDNKFQDVVGYEFYADDINDDEFEDKVE